MCVFFCISEQKKRERKKKKKQQHIDLMFNHSSFESFPLFTQIEYTHLKIYILKRFILSNLIKLTVPSEALAPTRVPRLFQQTSKIPPVPR